jgi:hypothetical protein
MSSYTTIDWEKDGGVTPVQSLFCQNLKLKTEKCEYEVILGVFNRKIFF